MSRADPLRTGGCPQGPGARVDVGTTQPEGVTESSCRQAFLTINEKCRQTVKVKKRLWG